MTILSAGASSHCCSKFGRSTGPEVVQAIQCNGTEYSLSECVAVSDDTSTCESMGVASVTCQRKYLGLIVAHLSG